MPFFPDEYREFRRRVMHLSALNLSRDLQVTPLSFEQTVALPLSPDRAQAIWCEASTRFLTRWIEGTPSVGPARNRPDRSPSGHREDRDHQLRSHAIAE